MAITELARNLMAFPPEDRAVYELLGCEDTDEFEEDPAEAEAAWAEEIKRRVDEIRNGTAVTYALEDVLAEMEELYG